MAPKTTRIIFSIVCMLLLTCLLMNYDSFAQSENQAFLGFSGYATSQSALENTVQVMERNGFSTYRVSFRPSWQSADGHFRNYNTESIDFLLFNTTFFIIVDGNHLYPPTDSSAKEARDHWTEVRSRIFQTLERYPNNSRVAVELINEYTSDDFDLRMQDLIDEVRTAGYTNPVVVNKLYTPWFKLSDPLDNTFQGMHFYFDSWSAESAYSQMRMAKSDGITKVLNSEVGASAEEHRDFTQANVDALEVFLSQCQTLGITNCVWMNDDADNWDGYIRNDFVFNVADPKPSVKLTLQPTSPPQSTPAHSTLPTSVPPIATQTPNPPAPNPTLAENESKTLPENVQRFPIICSSSPMLLL